MNANLNMTVELTPEDIETACREYVTRQIVGFGTQTMTATEVNFIVNNRSVGYGPGEHAVAFLEKATVSVVKVNNQDR